MRKNLEKPSVNSEAAELALLKTNVIEVNNKEKNLKNFDDISKYIRSKGMKTTKWTMIYYDLKNTYTYKWKKYTVRLEESKESKSGFSIVVQVFSKNNRRENLYRLNKNYNKSFDLVEWKYYGDPSKLETYDCSVKEKKNLNSQQVRNILKQFKDILQLR